MRRMERLRNSDKALSTLVIAVVAVLIIAAAGVGIYFLLSKDNGNAEGSDFSEAFIEKGAWGVGTEFTYNVVSGIDMDEDSDDEGEMIEAYALIVAESREYYIVRVIDEYDGMKFTFAMHKTDGTVRFAANDGTDSFTYEGDEKSLTNWRFTSVTYSATVSVNSEDCIPYKMEIMYLPSMVIAIFGSSDYSGEPFVLELKDITEVEAETYEPNDLDGEMIGLDISVEVTGYNTSISVSGDVAIVYAGWYSIDGEEGPVYLIKGNVTVKGNIFTASADMEIEVCEYILLGEDIQGAEYSLSGILAMIKSMDLEIESGGYLSKSQETIDTFQGSKECDVYTLKESAIEKIKALSILDSLVLKFYLGEDGTPYRAEMKASISGLDISATVNVTACIFNEEFPLPSPQG